MNVADLSIRGAVLPATGRSEEVELKRASQIRLADIEWLWPGWIAAKKFHVLAGDGGTGKTTLSLAMASVISKGGAWPSEHERKRKEFQVSWPFAPHLLRLLEEQVLIATDAQETRDMIRSQANVRRGWP